MYELYLLAQLNQLDTPVYISSTPTKVVVSSMRKRTNKNRSITYLIKLSDKTAEFAVNRCTYLANELDKPFVFEEANKWCKKEKTIYKTLWIY